MVVVPARVSLAIFARAVLTISKTLLSGCVVETEFSLSRILRKVRFETKLVNPSDRRLVTKVK